MSDSLLSSGMPTNKYETLLLDAVLTVPNNGWGYVYLPTDLNDYQEILVVVRPKNTTRGGGNLYLASSANVTGDIIGYPYKFYTSDFAKEGNVSQMTHLANITFGSYVSWYTSGSSPSRSETPITISTSLEGKRYLNCQNTSSDGPSEWYVTVLTR